MVMIIRALLVKLVSPSNRILFFSAIMCFFNTLLLTITGYYRQEACIRFEKSSFHIPNHNRPQNQYYRDPKDKRDPHWDVKDYGEVFKITVDGNFNWDAEFMRLMSIIPVLEYRSNETDAKGRKYMDVDDKVFVNPNSNFTQWDKTMEISTVLPVVRDSVELKQIYQKLYKFNNDKKQPSLLAGRDNILTCKDFKELEKSTSFPKIRYSFRSLSFWKGTFQLSDDETIEITQRRFLNTRTRDGGPNEGFEEGKIELMNIFKTRGWYGFPILYGLCITTIKEEDVTKFFLENDERALQKAYLIRYIVARYDETNSMPFCRGNLYSDECLRLNQISTFIRSNDRPAVVTLMAMSSLSKVFENIWLNRAYMDELNANELVMTKDFKVHVTGMHSLKFLNEDTYSLLRNTTRFLAGTICQRSKECPVPEWHTSQIGFKVGSACLETKGYCTMDNTCWGIDTHAHACMFSRWFISRLHSAVPPTWKYDHVLAKLIRCGAQGMPDDRCTWTDLRIGLEQLLTNATQTWPEKTSSV